MLKVPSLVRYLDSAKMKKTYPHSSVNLMKLNFNSKPSDLLEIFFQTVNYSYNRFINDKTLFHPHVWKPVWKGYSKTPVHTASLALSDLHVVPRAKTSIV